MNLETLGLGLGILIGAATVAWVFYMLGRLVEKLEDREADKPRPRRTIMFGGKEHPDYDPLCEDGDYCCPSVPKCPVEICRIKEPHSHADALIKRIKDQ